MTPQGSARTIRSALAPVLAAIVLLGACRTDDSEEVIQAIQAGRETDPGDPVLPVDWYRGPGVRHSPTGPARFVGELSSQFDMRLALDLLEYADGYYRAPGNEGYEAVLERLHAELSAAGFGVTEGLELEWIEMEPRVPAWTPRSASIALASTQLDSYPIAGSGNRMESATIVQEVLHEFREPGDADRVVLPVNARSCELTAGVALTLDELDEGEALVTEAPLRQVLRRASAKGAAAVVSSSLENFNTDPTGRERHLDAIHFVSVPADNELPAFQISPRSFARIVSSFESQGGAQLALAAVVETEQRPLRTLVATVVGAARPEEAVVVVSHVQEPGANDNASGLSGVATGAIAIARALEGETLARPARSIAFVWGDEFLQSEAWIEQSGRTAVVGISADMIGQSREETGAIALLERMPDPGAVRTLPPDEHTPWGAGEVVMEDLVPNGLSIVARCAMVDVGLAAGGWDAADHPWEGGSDHDVFIRGSVPGVLFWHFTDFAYHTSLDRLDKVDLKEMRRMTTAALATALAVADPKPEDLKRYVDSVNAERVLRVEVALSADDEALAEAWRTWTTGARNWLRVLCWGLADEEDGEPVRVPAEGETEAP